MLPLVDCRRSGNTPNNGRDSWRTSLCATSAAHTAGGSSQARCANRQSCRFVEPQGSHQTSHCDNSKRGPRPLLELAEREGFEPSKSYPLHTFQACSFDRSDTSPTDSNLTVPMELAVTQSSHTPAHESAATVAPFRAWRSSQLAVARGPERVTIVRIHPGAHLIETTPSSVGRRARLHSLRQHPGDICATH